MNRAAPPTARMGNVTARVRDLPMLAAFEANPDIDP
jgi:hypothetical protein